MGSGDSPFGIAMGAYLTITCSEGAATIRDEDIVRETAGTFLGDYRTRRHVRACEEWPTGSVPAAYWEPVRSNVPVLMLSGDIDGATPAHFGAAVAMHGSARDLDTACLDHVERPPFATELPGGSR